MSKWEAKTKFHPKKSTLKMSTPIGVWISSPIFPSVVSVNFQRRGANFIREIHWSKLRGLATRLAHNDTTWRPGAHPEGWGWWVGLGWVGCLGRGSTCLFWWKMVVKQRQRTNVRFLKMNLWAFKYLSIWHMTTIQDRYAFSLSLSIQEFCWQLWSCEPAFVI